MGEISFKVQDSISGQKSSAARKYQRMIVGSNRWWDLIKYELVVLLVARLPGALGLILRAGCTPGSWAGSVGAWPSGQTSPYATRARSASATG